MRSTLAAPCRLSPGDIRRVPKDASLGVVGYHVACPRCGWKTIILRGVDAKITETAGRVTIEPAPRCARCGTEAPVVGVPVVGGRRGRDC